MFNFHIGVPGVFPDLLHSAERSGVLKTEDGPQVLSRRLWQKRFRSLINANNEETASSIVTWHLAEAVFSEMSKKGPVAGSQHAVLGRVEDCLRGKRMLRQTEARISRLRNLFSATPIVYHLTIQSQFDYLLAAHRRYSKDQPSNEHFVAPSWSRLVERIKAADPESKICVWDFDQPNRMLFAFLVSLLDVTSDRHISAVKSFLKESSLFSEIYLESQDIPEFLQRTVDELDDQYERELEVISRISGVSLILPENVPVEFYL